MCELIAIIGGVFLLLSYWPEIVAWCTKDLAPWIERELGGLPARLFRTAVAWLDRAMVLTIRGCRKLHLGVDGDGVIVGQQLTGASVDDGNVGVDLGGGVPGKICRVTGDGAYDNRALYDAAAGRGAKVVVPPVKTAQTGGRGCRARDRAIRRIRKVGRRQWQKESGYHQQARAENTLMRYKRMLGDRLHARDADGQSVEARLACNILNRMTELGMPASYAVRM
ncbi:MAG: hypothetical protein ACJAYX_003918 [Planctomycetota bacterium]|jgi:hypothetical protein